MPDGSAADTRSVPRSAATRSRMFARPPVDAAAGSSVPMPHPSSVIAMRRCPLLRASATDACVALRVLRGVRERLAHDVVRGRLDVVGEPLGAHRGVRLDGERDRESRDARLDRGDEAVVAQHRRVDAAGELAQVGERLAGLVLQLDELFGRELAALQPVAGEAQPGDLRHHVLLDAVVQVALEALALVVLCGDEPLARRGQLVELLGELRGQAHVGDGCRSLAGDRVQQRSLRLAVVAAAARAELDAAERLVAAHEVARLHGREIRTGSLAGDTHRRRGEVAVAVPMSLIRTHEASSPSRTASASRVSRSRGSTASSSRAPSSLSIVSWRSRSPKTARWIHRCIHVRSGSRQTASSVVIRIAGTTRSRPASRMAGVATAAA